MKKKSLIRIYPLKKSVLTPLLGLFALHIIAQAPDTPKQLPDLGVTIPPSPTVAGFMKFEEVPVDNYSGIPNTSIPIFNVGTHSKDVGINLSLDYHPGSIVPGEESSYVGLGWSLTGGGTISRTVKGMPDERKNDGDKYGIHNEINPYWEARDAIGNVDSLHVLAQYIYDTDGVGRYDTEHDIYQVNFMGKSARFYITNKCSNQNPCYHIERLDNDNVLVITYNNDPVNPSFTVLDDKGYKYIFDVPEVSTVWSSSNLYYKGSDKLVADPNPMIYVSAVHLSKIFDRNSNLLVEFSFTAAPWFGGYCRKLA